MFYFFPYKKDLVSNIEEANDIISSSDDDEMKELAKLELEENIPKKSELDEEIKLYQNNLHFREKEIIRVKKLIQNQINLAKNKIDYYKKMIPDFFPSSESLTHFPISKTLIGLLIVLFATFVGIEIRLDYEDDEK